MQSILVEVVLVGVAGTSRLEVSGPAHATIRWFVTEALTRAGITATEQEYALYLDVREVRPESILQNLARDSRPRLRIVFCGEDELPTSAASDSSIDLEGEGGQHGESAGEPQESASRVDLDLVDLGSIPSIPTVERILARMQQERDEGINMDVALVESVALDPSTCSSSSDSDLHLRVPRSHPQATPDSGLLMDLRQEEDSSLTEQTAEEEQGPAVHPWLLMKKEEAAPTTESEAEQGAKPGVRFATVRYYDRMNPDRLHPLVVTLSREEVDEVPKTTRSVVEVAPILPGCDCYPPSALVKVGAREGVAFAVVPHVLGPLPHARVVLCHKQDVLAEIPLEVRVGKQTAALVLSAAGLVLPFAWAVLRSSKVDFEPQREEGFSVYLRLLQLAMQGLSPGGLGCLLLVAAGLAYLWVRPRQQKVLWDLAQRTPVGPPVQGLLGRALRCVTRFALVGVSLGFLLGVLLVAVIAATSSLERALRVAPLLLVPLPALGFIGGLLGEAIDGALARE